MPTIKNWISAFRLRTLFLAIATVILGSALAWHEGMFFGKIFFMALILAVSLQILSNLANDLGDYQKGTDTTGDRKGPIRSLQRGYISLKQMEIAVGLGIIWVAIIGLTLVIYSTKFIGWKSTIIMLIIGLLCILAAVFYTLSKHAYGYKGWGDFFAFLFFGPVSVIGTYFLHVHSLDFQPVLPAIGIGLTSTMILNINNMRDIDNDLASGKITIAVKLGLKNAKIYHLILTCTMCLCFISYSIIYASFPWHRYLYTFVFLLSFIMLFKIFHKSGKDLDPYLKYTSLFSLLLVIAFALCIN
ncbi:MAG TPA: 1,4-dihydroxy-2-naphthoate octaprenyltransferase [Bacteroidales bacterium]|nr:1,4-dihydroxy-2-naphthoate octaprenyltransferase [Bacteroidales bacterium]